MRMENENENFDQLKKLLALKKHELPPPGYFNKLPGEVISRIRAERAGENVGAMQKLEAEAPWLVRFWKSLEGKPIFAGAFGATICSLVLAAIFLAEKPATQPTFAGPHNTSAVAPFLAATPVGIAGAFDQPVLMAATNQGVPNLFDLIPNGGLNSTVPVSVSP
jgi:hypothetical protein